MRRLEASPRKHKVSAAADPMDVVRERPEPRSPAKPRAQSEGGANTALGAITLGLGLVSAGLTTAAFITNPGLLACVCVSIPLILGTIFLLIAGISMLTAG